MPLGADLREKRNTLDECAAKSEKEATDVPSRGASKEQPPSEVVALPERDVMRSKLVIGAEDPTRAEARAGLLLLTTMALSAPKKEILLALRITETLSARLRRRRRLLHRY
jgi:hypothetical protein